MSIVGGCGDPLVHLALFLGKVAIERAFLEPGGFSLDEAQRFKVSPLKMAGEALDRNLVLFVEA
jgi:hypothetical protein